MNKHPLLPDPAICVQEKRKHNWRQEGKPMTSAGQTFLTSAPRCGGRREFLPSPLPERAEE